MIELFVVFFLFCIVNLWWFFNFGNRVSKSFFGGFLGFCSRSRFLFVFIIRVCGCLENRVFLLIFFFRFLVVVRVLMEVVVLGDMKDLKEEVLNFDFII